MITAIVLNWKRPENMARILDALRQASLVSEIIVWNNNREIHFVAGDDVCVVNSSRDLGLFTRFTAASLAKNEGILFQDDDVVLKTEMIETLYREWKREPRICHAAFGRSCWSGPYNRKNAWGDVDVVLTTAVLVHRSICLQAAMNSQYLCDIQGTPEGNGEDILLSYTAMAMSGKPNRSHDLCLSRELQDPSISINQRVANHAKHRTLVLRRCRTLFSPDSAWVASAALLWKKARMLQRKERVRSFLGRIRDSMRAVYVKFRAVFSRTRRGIV